MRLIVSEKAGYCFGVQRAIRKAQALLDREEQRKVYSLGPLIHNEQATQKLMDEGLFEANGIEEVDGGSIVVIRSHGLGERYYALLEEKGCRIEDATCPFVKKIQMIARDHANEGKEIIIVGDASHPEIEGINLWAGGNCIIGKEIEDFEKIKFSSDKEYVVVAQTTFSVEKYRRIKTFLEAKIKNLKIFDTICDATRERQEDAIKIAQNVDVMIIVGGRHSSNTKKLYELCSQFCKTFLIETANDIDVDEIKIYDNIGMTAGASTPDFIIDEVIDLIVHTKKHGKELGIDE